MRQIFFRRSGHFPEIVIPVLRKAIRQMNLSRLLKNTGYLRSLSEIDVHEEKPKAIKEKATIKKVQTSQFVDIAEEEEKDLFGKIARLNKKTARFRT